MFRFVDGRYLVSSEALGYWFLRLNGFLTIPNFVVHPDTGSQQGTDVDVLGVRFPYRKENRHRPMRDSDRFTRPHRDKAYVALAEIKTGVCRLNGPWTAPERENMQRVLSALGMLSPHEIDFAAQEVYDKGYFENQLYYVSMVCFGSEPRDEITERYPWSEIVKSSLSIAAYVYAGFFVYGLTKSKDERGEHSALGLGVGLFFGGLMGFNVWQKCF